MSAYVIFQFTIRDQTKLSAYAAQAVPTVAAHGGRPVSMGKAIVLYGSELYEQGTIFEFPDRASAQAWHASTEYKTLLNLRSEAMDCSVTVIG
jgi:uncharacterized protein (DUF1330 family)